jgi:hypothetical protein
MEEIVIFMQGCEHFRVRRKLRNEKLTVKHFKFEKGKNISKSIVEIFLDSH